MALVDQLQTSNERHGHEVENYNDSGEVQVENDIGGL